MCRKTTISNAITAFYNTTLKWKRQPFGLDAAARDLFSMTV